MISKVSRPLHYLYKVVPAMRSSSPKICFSVLLTLSTLGFLYLSPSLFSSSSPISSSTVKKPVHILIVSSWRSGSSFLGSIFNNHPDVFYIFEPGFPIWMKLSGESSELLHYPTRDLLRSLLTCDVSPLHFYLPNGGNQLSEYRYFTESRAICTSTACQFSDESLSYDRSTCLKVCGGKPLETIEGVCRNYNHIAGKTVRIFDLKVLLPLLHDPKLDLRILHLVRDPRAVASSRRYFNLEVDDMIVQRGETLAQRRPSNPSPSILAIMAKICKSQVEIHKVGRDPKYFPPGRYMLIRHEDLAWDPLPNANKVYSFGDLSMTPQLEQWLYNVTHQDNSEKLDVFMSYERDAQKVTEKWRMTMDFNEALKIQTVCREAMGLFGYLPVTSTSDLTLEMHDVEDA
uniref:Sulfotransferase n=1 Tax=Leptobrachium leishanense TaxID=445787 RepID=A0A8C5PP62_9ANUR